MEDQEPAMPRDVMDVLFGAFSEEALVFPAVWQLFLVRISTVEPRKQLAYVFPSSLGKQEVG